MKRQLAHVMWLGGTPAAGKTTIAKLLAQKYELEVYHRDQHDACHAARAIAGPGYPISKYFDGLSAEERWIQQTVHDNVVQGMEVAQERVGMVNEDILAFPSDLPILVEGIGFYPRQLFPYLSDADQALWLIADRAFSEAVWTTRRETGQVPILNGTSDPETAWHHILERNSLLAHYIQEQADSLGLTAMCIDRMRTLEYDVAAVETFFHFRLSQSTCPRSVPPGRAG